MRQSRALKQKCAPGLSNTDPSRRVPLGRTELAVIGQFQVQQFLDDLVAPMRFAQVVNPARKCLSAQRLSMPIVAIVAPPLARSMRITMASSTIRAAWPPPFGARELPNPCGRRRAWVWLRCSSLKPNRSENSILAKMHARLRVWLQQRALRRECFRRHRLMMHAARRLR